MKILITGAGGQLGHDLIKVLTPHHQCWAMSRKDIDVTESSQVIQAMEYIRPDAIIHAAAFTNVDSAEEEVEEAYRVNAFGTRNIAISANRCQAKLVYISTDYVFDGNKGSPYTELDQPSPIGIYGSSKYLGEQWTADFCSQYFILRTAWLFGIHGNNFVKKIYSLANNQQDITAVSDQIGSPTYSLDLARFINHLIGTQKYGVYHVSNRGYCTRLELARATLKAANITDVNCTAASLSQFKLRAPRPKNSALSDWGRRLNHLPLMRDWKEAVESFVIEELSVCNED